MYIYHTDTHTQAHIYTQKNDEMTPPQIMQTIPYLRAEDDS